MSLNKSIKHKKEKRKEYRGSKKWDKTCHNHGACGYCKNNRTYKNRKAEQKANQKLKEAESADYYIYNGEIYDVSYDAGEDDHLETEKITKGLNRYLMDSNKTHEGIRKFFDSCPNEAEIDYSNDKAFCITWSLEGTGFGELIFFIDENTGEWKIDSETMGRDTIKKILGILVDSLSLVDEKKNV